LGISTASGSIVSIFSAGAPLKMYSFLAEVPVTVVFNNVGWSRANASMVSSSGFQSGSYLMLR